MGYSIIDRLALASPAERKAYIHSLDEDDLQLLLDRDWSVTARPEQIPPTDEWFCWFIRAGRGWGKTLTGAEATCQKIEELTPLVPDGKVRWALGAPRHPDLINIMFEGETGLHSILPPSMLIGGSWEKSFTRGAVPELTLATGAILQGYPATVPAGPRGPQFHGGWCDEPGTYPDAHLGLGDDTFMANLLFGMRLDPFGGLIVTGTPKNNRLIKELRKLDGVVETHGRTRDNVHNLTAAFKKNVVGRYVGTRLGRQELDAEIIEGVGVMFQRGWFKPTDKAPWPKDTVTRSIRYWDLASGEESDANPDPDWTVGARVTMDPTRRLYVIDHVERFRKGPGARELTIARVAKEDGLPRTWIEKEPGNAGLAQLHMIGRELESVGVSVKGNPATGPKAVRAELVATAAQQGRVWMIEGDWNLAFLDEVEEFHPDPLLSGAHDDQVDAVAGAFNMLKGGQSAQVVSTPATMPDIPKPSAVRRSGPAGLDLGRVGSTRPRR